MALKKKRAKVDEREKPEKLTKPLNVPISPELKDAVDDAAIKEGIATNEWVAKVLALHLGRPELAAIPRLPMGRRRIREDEPLPA